MLQAKLAANQLLVIVQLPSFIPDRAPIFYLRWFSLVKKVVGKSHTFSHKIDSCLRRITLLLNEDDEARDIPGFMATSNGIRKKLLLQGKVFYWHRWQCKHTFHRASLSKQVNEEQQSLLKQNENREKQDLPEATPELYQDAETPSKTSNRARGWCQGNVGSELQSDHPSTIDETQHQPNMMIQHKKVAKANKSVATNQKKETFTVIPPAPNKNQRLNTEKSLLTRDGQNGNRNAESGSKKKKSLEIVVILSRKQVVDMGRLFEQQYFQLHLNFNGIVNHKMGSGFSSSSLIPNGDIPSFIFDLSRWMLRTVWY